jgi:hypothetical protein
MLLALTAALVAYARGFVEPAQAAARQIAEAQERFRRARGGEQLALATFRTRVPSLQGRASLAGERALAYRSFVQQRRMLLPGMLAGGFALDAGVPLVLVGVAPGFTWAWAAVGLAGAWLTAASMLAVELEHHPLRMAPLRPLPALGWLASVPATHRVVSTEIAWLPMLLVPGVTPGGWLVGAMVIPCVVALFEAGGALAVVLADGSIARLALKAGLALGGLLPAAIALLTAVALDLPAFALALVTAALLLAAAAALFSLSARQIWPRRPPC